MPKDHNVSENVKDITCLVYTIGNVYTCTAVVGSTRGLNPLARTAGMVIKNH